jgi:hypothetical protein
MGGVQPIRRVLAVPLFLRDDRAAFRYFRDYRNEIHAITGRTVIVGLPRAVASGDASGVAKALNGKRFQGLQPTDFPCLWIEREKAHFILKLPNTHDGIRDLLRRLVQEVREASSLKELETRMSTQQPSPPDQGREIHGKLAFAFGIAFIVAILILAIVFPNPTPFQYTIFRIVIALAAAGFAAEVPGMLDVRIANWVKATGALAVFVLVFFYNPATLIAQTPPTTPGTQTAEKPPQKPPVNTTQEPAPPELSADEKKILDLKDRVKELQSKFEATYSMQDKVAFERARDTVTSECKTIAETLDTMPFDGLTVDTGLIKLAYAGMAWTLAASATDDEAEKRTFSASAIHDLQEAVKNVDIVKAAADKHDPDMSKLNEALNKDRFRPRGVHFLAVAQAINALNKGNATFEQAVTTYQSLPSTFKREYPITDNVYLKQASEAYTRSQGG